MLQTYARENNLHVVGEYVDDGWSGTNYDRLNGESELAQFLNILNEMHARQTSKKIKAALRIRRMNGAHWGPHTPPMTYSGRCRVKSPTVAERRATEPRISSQDFLNALTAAGP